MNLHKTIVFFLSLLIFSTLGSVAFANTNGIEKNEDIYNINSNSFVDTFLSNSLLSSKDGMYVCGKKKKSNGDVPDSYTNTGHISCNAGAGMAAANYYSLFNRGTISAYVGMEVEYGIAENHGTIDAAGVSSSRIANSTGMYGITVALMTNYGTITNTSYGMYITGIGPSAYIGSTNYGTISCVYTHGMYGMNVDSTNENQITLCNTSTIGMYAAKASTATNTASGNINCDNKNSSTGMSATDHATITNNGNILDCTTGMYVESNSTGYNHVLISCESGSVNGVIARNNSTITNNGNILNCTTGMYVESNSSGYNFGLIGCGSSNVNGVIAINSNFVNAGQITNCLNGVLADRSTAVNNVDGTISCSQTHIGSGSVGMKAINGGTLVNNGSLHSCESHMEAEGTASFAINSGNIGCDPDSTNSFGMKVSNGGIAMNKDIILSCVVGMRAEDINSSAINENEIICRSGGVGMYAVDGGTVVNRGTIKNCYIGMQANANSTAINDLKGIIRCASNTDVGMRSVNGGTITNFGQIIGCSDSPRVASDEPSISLAIAMADDETIPSTTGSTPRGALSYDIGYGVTASYINSGLTNQSMGGSFVEVTGSGTLAIKNSGTILCGSGLEECFGMNGTHNTTYEASVGAGNTMGSVIVLDDSTINIPQTSIIGGAIPDKEYTYKDVFVSSGGGSITGADNITSGSIVWNVTPVTNANSVDVIVTKNSYTDLASAEHSAIASVLEANYNGSNLYQSLNQKDIKSFNSALNQLSGADLSGGRGANLDSMSLINKADSGFNSRQDFISSYEGSYEKQSSFASNVGDITMGETQNQLTDNVTVRSVMAISQVSNNPLYNTYSYRYAGRVGLGKNYGFYTNTQLLQASSYNARTMDLGSGVSTLGRIENVTAIISDNYAYVSAKASDNVTLLAYSGASTSYSIFSNSTEQASSSDMQFAALNLGGYNQTVVSAVIGQEIAYKSKANGTLSLMAKVSTPIMSIGNERTASFSTGESFIVNTGAEIGVYTATLGMNYLLGDTATKGFNAKVSAYREINSIEINDNAYATLGYAF